MKTLFYKISAKILIPVLILALSTSAMAAYYNTGLLTRAKGLFWTWVGGSSSKLPSGTYTTIGSSSSSNHPSAREGHVSWKDSSGNIWLFGGYGYDGVADQGLLNDLWKFDSTTGNWTWVSGSKLSYGTANYGVKGTASASNVPGPRENATSWMDSTTGNLWLFGGNGLDSAGSVGLLNDLWKFSPGTGQWTWMSGKNIVAGVGTYGTKGTGSTANTPGARNQQAGWADASGNLWLFGGISTAGSYNDLWKFNTSTNQWTWMSGFSSANGAATYGTKGTGSTLNVPGARADHSMWGDSTSVWIFGGNGLDSVSSTGDLNDIWRYNISSGQWTWMNGSNVRNAAGVYGALGVSSGTTTPGARSASSAAVDGSGKFVLFGGEGYDSGGLTRDTLGDLWSFDPASAQWTWRAGSSSVGQAGNYGTLNVTNGSNVIGTRRRAAMAFDSSSNLWIFGGRGAIGLAPLAYLEDHWKYNYSGGLWTWVSGRSDSAHIPFFGTMGVANANNAPGKRADALTVADPAGNLWLFGGYGVDGSDQTASMNDLWRYSPVTKQWTWMSGGTFGFNTGIYGTKGIGSTANIPGSRYGGMMWADANGYVWVMGGDGLDSTGTEGPLNDLWKYEIATGKWTWVTGSNTITAPANYGTRGSGNTSTAPGGRTGGRAWMDASGNFWLFGGDGFDDVGNNGALNDLWKFQSGLWTWVSGAKLANQFGVYGTKGVASSSNSPGGRSYSSVWPDKNGNFWFFGGRGYGVSGAASFLNDLWKYDPSLDQWMWVAGATATDQASVYGAKGVANTANGPGGRYAAVTWKDVQGNFYLMGGSGLYSGSGAGGSYGNDVWKYNPNINQWAWIGGSQALEPPGTYGVLGVAAPGNIPSGRFVGGAWSTPGGLWLYGGEGTLGGYCDLWRIQAK